MDHLHSLRAFVTVAQIGSFSKAADCLKLSRPTTSRLIDALETRLGVRLLQRTTRRLKLTEAGDLFFERARAIIDDVETAERIITYQHKKPVGVLRIATPVAFGLHYLAPLLVQYLSRYPEVVPHVTSTDEAVDMVAGRFDVLLTPLKLQPNSTLVMRQFSQSAMHFVASPAYIARRGLPSVPDGLAQHTFLTHTSFQLNIAQQSIEKILSESLNVNQCIHANTLEMLHSFAVGSLGIALLPAYRTAKDLSNGSLVEVLQGHQITPINMNVAFTSRHHMSAKIRTFVDFVLETFAIPPSTGANTLTCPRPHR